MKSSVIYKYNETIHIIHEWIKHKIKLKKMFMLKYLNALLRNSEFRQHWSYYGLKKNI